MHFLFFVLFDQLTAFIYLTEQTATSSIMALTLTSQRLRDYNLHEWSSEKCPASQYLFCVSGSDKIHVSCLVGRLAVSAGGDPGLLLAARPGWRERALPSDVIAQRRDPTNHVRAQVRQHQVLRTAREYSTNVLPARKMP